MTHLTKSKEHQCTSMHLKTKRFLCWEIIHSPTLTQQWLFVSCCTVRAQIKPSPCSLLFSLMRKVHGNPNYWEGWRRSCESRLHFIDSFFILSEFYYGREWWDYSENTWFANSWSTDSLTPTVCFLRAHMLKQKMHCFGISLHTWD